MQLRILAWRHHRLSLHWLRAGSRLGSIILGNACGARLQEAAARCCREQTGTFSLPTFSMGFSLRVFTQDGLFGSGRVAGSWRVIQVQPVGVSVAGGSRDQRQAGQIV